MSSLFTAKGKGHMPKATSRPHWVPKRKSTDMAQVGLRLPERLRKMVDAEARKGGRSLNAELVRRLEQSFAQQVTEDTIKATSIETGRIVILVLNNLIRAVGKSDLVVTDDQWRSLVAHAEVAEDQLRAQVGDAENQSAPTTETARDTGDRALP